VEEPYSIHLKELLRQANHAALSPLSAIINAVDLLLLENLSETAKLHVEGMAFDAQRLIAAVNTLVDFVEVALSPLQQAPLNVGALMENSVKNFREENPESAVAFRIEISSNTIEILGDAKALQRTMGLLLKNAAHFSQAGAITLKASMDSGQVHVEISDYSTEIKEQSATSPSPNMRIRDVWGLELLLCRQIIQLHGGLFYDGSNIHFAVPCFVNN